MAPRPSWIGRRVRRRTWHWHWHWLLIVRPPRGLLATSASPSPNDGSAEPQYPSASHGTTANPGAPISIPIPIPIPLAIVSTVSIVHAPPRQRQRGRFDSQGGSSNTMNARVYKSAKQRSCILPATHNACRTLPRPRPQVPSATEAPASAISDLCHRSAKSCPHQRPLSGPSRKEAKKKHKALLPERLPPAKRSGPVRSSPLRGKA
ncbi:hypothetical protein E4U53_003476 [Claviceps sorghi]|nr:hypothetical protein E4U53_003476 [Claviceps sorghi]